jgi:DoxX-like family
VETVLRAPHRPRATVWTARTLRALVVLFLLFDAVGHFAMPAPVADAFSRLGLPLSAGPALAVLQFVLLAAYVTPRSNVLGAILLTGYLGGAAAVNVRAGSPLFETLFPIIVGALVWAPLYLTEPRLRSLLPPYKDR